MMLRFGRIFLVPTLKLQGPKKKTPIFFSIFLIRKKYIFCVSDDTQKNMRAKRDSLSVLLN